MTATFYSFLVGEHKAGYQTVRYDSTTRTKVIETVFEVDGDWIEARHTLRYNTNGSIRSFQADDGAIHPLPWQAPPCFPTCAFAELINQVKLRVGAQFIFTALDDATGEPIGETVLAVIEHRMYTNPLTRRQALVFKVVEVKDGEVGRHFLVDAAGRIHEAFWRGAKSVLVESETAAKSGLALPA